MTLKVTQCCSKVRRVLSGPIRAFSGKGLPGIDWGTMAAEEGRGQVSGGTAEGRLIFHMMDQGGLSAGEEEVARGGIVLPHLEVLVGGYRLDGEGLWGRAAASGTIYFGTRRGSFEVDKAKNGRHG